MPDPIQPDPSITIPPPPRKSRLKLPGIVVASSVVLMLSGCGLCSVGGVSLEGTDAHPTVVGFGTVFFFLGVGGFIVGLLWFCIAIVVGSGPQGKTQ